MVLWCNLVTYASALWNFEKANFVPYHVGEKNHKFSSFWTLLSPKIFALGISLHAHVLSFTQNAVLSLTIWMRSPRKLGEPFTILTFLLIKTNVAYRRLDMKLSPEQRSARQNDLISERNWFFTSYSTFYYPPVSNGKKHGCQRASLFYYYICLQ